MNPVHIHLGPTFAHYRKALESDLWFKRNVPEHAKQAIERCIPYPLSLNLTWNGKNLHCATDDLFEWRVIKTYGGLLRRWTVINMANAVATSTELQRFYHKLQIALQTIHSKHAIMFYLQGQDDTDAYEQQTFPPDHEQNRARIETDIVPELLDYLSLQTTTHEEKKSVAWIVNTLFTYIPSDINNDYVKTLIQLIESTMGFDAYIDTYNQEILDKLKSKL